MSARGKRLQNVNKEHLKRTQPSNPPSPTIPTGQRLDFIDNLADCSCLIPRAATQTYQPQNEGLCTPYRHPAGWEVTKLGAPGVRGGLGAGVYGMLEWTFCVTIILFPFCYTLARLTAWRET